MEDKNQSNTDPILSEYKDAISKGLLQLSAIYIHCNAMVQILDSVAIGNIFIPSNLVNACYLRLRRRCFQVIDELKMDREEFEEAFSADEVLNPSDLDIVWEDMMRSKALRYLSQIQKKLLDISNGTIDGEIVFLNSEDRTLQELSETRLKEYTKQKNSAEQNWLKSLDSIKPINANNEEKTVNDLNL